ncbi:Diaminopimelate epimerase-like protein [Wilcoxina mikolae CBS 423.85]|nr:Diaminopimelate epimerase-like protein [Wilcoxina mikolae CBS 423.85]
MPKLTYTILDVFTTTRYSGNQLAIVNAQSPGTLTTEQQHLITSEFGFAETVFYHPPQEPGCIPIRIFSPGEEIPFAGHPTIGTGFYFLSGLSADAPRDAITLLTKAGKVPITRNPSTGSVRVQVPIDFKIHPVVDLPSVKTLQGNLNAADYVVDKLPVVSIVKGMNCVFLELSSEDAVSRLGPYAKPPVLPEGHMGEWDTGTGVMVYAFFVQEEGEVTKVRTRMFYGAGNEDAATGSAASALSGWLAVRNGGGGSRRRRFEILQGVEMKRSSEISVEVEVGEGGEVVGVAIEGKAVKVMEGQLEI